MKRENYHLTEAEKEKIHFFYIDSSFGDCDERGDTVGVASMMRAIQSSSGAGSVADHSERKKAVNYEAPDDYSDGMTEGELGTCDTAHEVASHVMTVLEQCVHNLLISSSIHCYILPDHRVQDMHTFHRNHDRVDHMAKFEQADHDKSSADGVDTEYYSELAKRDMGDDDDDDPNE